MLRGQLLLQHGTPNPRLVHTQRSLTQVQGAAGRVLPFAKPTFSDVDSGQAQYRSPAASPPVCAKKRQAFLHFAGKELDKAAQQPCAAKPLCQTSVTDTGARTGLFHMAGPVTQSDKRGKFRPHHVGQHCSEGTALTLAVLVSRGSMVCSGNKVSLGALPSWAAELHNNCLITSPPQRERARK